MRELQRTPTLPGICSILEIPGKIFQGNELSLGFVCLIVLGGCQEFDRRRDLLLPMMAGTTNFFLISASTILYVCAYQTSMQASSMNAFT